MNGICFEGDRVGVVAVYRCVVLEEWAWLLGLSWRGERVYLSDHVEGVSRMHNLGFGVSAIHMKIV